jgi:hypothetical protein
MASKIYQPVNNDTSTSGNTLIVVEDLKKWTARLVASGTFNWEARMIGSQGETGSQGYLLASGTGDQDVIVNDNDGNGCQVCAYAIYLSWSSLSGGGGTPAITIGLRGEY